MILTNAAKKPAQRTANSTQMAFGKVSLSDTLWSQLPPGAQKAINDHNNQVMSSPGRQVNTHGQIAQVHPPQDNPTVDLLNLDHNNQSRQAHGSGQTPPSTQHNKQNASQPDQPFLHQMMSGSNAQSERILNHQGHTYFRMSSEHKMHYKCIRNALSQVKERALVDGGTNGGFAGSDCRLIEYTDRFADVTGINDAKVENVPIGTVAAKVITKQGPVIGIMHQYAIHD